MKKLTLRGEKILHVTVKKKKSVTATSMKKLEFRDTKTKAKW